MDDHPYPWFVGDGDDGGDDGDDAMQDEASGDDEEDVLGWQDELSILYLGPLTERIEFLNERNGTMVTSFGVHAIFEILLGNDYCGDTAEALVGFMSALASDHPAVCTQMAKAFMDFPWRLLDTIQSLAVVSLSLALRLLPLLSCLDEFEPSWVSRNMTEDEGWNLFNLPLSRVPSQPPSRQDEGVPVAERSEGMKIILKFLLKHIKETPQPKPVLMNRFIAFVLVLLLDEEDNEDGDGDGDADYKDALVCDVFGESVTDARPLTAPRFALGALVGCLVGKDEERLHPQIIDLVGTYMESDIVWAILTELSVKNLEWLAPLLSPEAAGDYQEDKDGLALDHVALDLLEAGLQDPNMMNDPCLRGTMLNVLWFLSNLAAEDVYKPIFVQERPMRVFVGCWSIPSLHDTVTLVFKNLFTPDEATVDMLNRVGWPAAYRQSSEILDVLDI